MSDETKDLDQQGNSPDQQPSGTQTTDNWEDRFKGLQRKFNTLMETNGALESQLAEIRLAREEKEKQLATLSNEKDSIQQKTQKQIDDLSAQLQEKEQKLSELSQMQLKVKVANDLGHPELLQLIDTIPNTDDPEQIEGAMKTILDFTQTRVAQREQQLSEGLMPGETATDGSTLPSTEQGWVEMIDKLPLGSSEREEAMDKYFNFLRNNE